MKEKTKEQLDKEFKQLQQRNTELMKKNEERVQTELQLAEERAAVNTILSGMLRGESDEAAIEKLIVDTCLATTDSVYSMMGRINKHGQWDTTAYASGTIEACAFPEALGWELSTGMPIRGIWGWPLIHGQAMICNDPASHPDRTGAPKGHVPVEHFLGVPLKDGEKVMGMIAVLNKPGGYTEADKETLARLAAVVDISRQRREAEKEINAVNQKLKANNQQLVASEQQLKAANQQLQASEQQLKAANQQLSASEQKIKATNRQLSERAKELNCLYGISKIVEIPGISLEEAFERVVELIPASWQYPEIAVCRIILDDKEYKTPEFKKTKWKLCSNIIVDGNHAGDIEVYYLEKKPDSDEGPFMKEERMLLDIIAERFGRITERKKAQEERDNFLNLSIDLFCIAGMDGYFKYVNPAWEYTLGYSEEELLSKPFLDFIHPEDHNKNTEEVENLSRGIKTIAFENRYIHKDNSVRTISWTAIPIVEKEIIYCIGRDITERKQAEEKLKAYNQQLQASEQQLRAANQQLDASNQQLTANEQQLKAANQQLVASSKQLRESESKFKRLYDSNIIGTIFWDTAGNITQANNEFLRIVGYTEEDVLSGKVRWKDMTPLEYAPLDEKALKEIAETGVSVPFEKEYIRKDGSRVPVLIGAVIFKGQKDLGICFVMDITERKQAEEELKKHQEHLEELVEERTMKLKESEQKFMQLSDEYETILDHLPALVFYKDTENNFIRVNKYISDAYGKKKSELEGINLSQLHSAEDAKKYHADDLEVIKSKKAKINIEETWQTEEGMHWVLTSKIPYIDENGEVKGLIGIATDITERKRAEEMLKEAQKELRLKDRLATLGQFSGSISHEIKNPLGVIDSSIFYLKSVLQGADEKVLQHLDRIKKNTDKSKDIIESLRSLTKIKEPETASVNLKTFLPEIISSLAVPGHIKLTEKISEEEIIVSADKQQLIMVIDNLFRNSVDAIKGKGSIDVSLEKIKDEQALLIFSDTGEGIEKANLEKIFLPLFSTKAQGIGFGLSLVKMIIEAHQGKIEVVSEKGKGAQFMIYLPIKKVKKEESK